MHIRMVWPLLLAAFLSAAIDPRASAQSDDRAEQLLQAAMQKELVEGDLEAAIKLYRSIVATSGSRRVSARALVRIGRCFEKLGSAEARKQYEQVLRDYADQAEAAGEARARLQAIGAATSLSGPATMVVRRVWDSANMFGMGSISNDGRSLAGIDWDTGDLTITELASRQKRRLTRVRSAWDEFAEASAFAPDDKQVAYVWMATDGTYELRVVGVDAAEPRVLHRSAEVSYIRLLEWAPDGRHIAAVFNQKDGTNSIVLVAFATGTLRVLKTLDWRYPHKLCFSPDGRYLAYDFPPVEDAPERDVFLLATDASHEIAVVQHPANDFVLGWAPDGRRLVFGSDRSGSVDAWIVGVADGKPQGLATLLRPDMGRTWPIRLTREGAYYYGVPISVDDVYVGTLDQTLTRLVAPPTAIVQRYVGNKWPEWSPDGKQLAYVSQLRAGVPEALALTIRSLETGKERQLYPRLNYFSRLRWSPDGRWIVANARDHRNRGGLVKIDGQTAEVSMLVRNAGSGYPRQAAWFPDGKALLYWSLDTPDAPIRRLALETGADEPVHPGADFALSPDGRWLVVNEYDRATKSSTLKLASAAALAAPRALMRSDGFGAFTWTPDGRYLLCIKAGTASAPRELWRVSIDDGSSLRLFVADSMNEVRIHPDGRRIAFQAGQLKAELWVMENFLPPLGPTSTSRRK